jgi:tetratricopeptide (TPR) repeat protein
MAQTYNNLGIVYWQKGEWDKAIEFYQKSLVIYEKVGDVHGMAKTWQGLGNVYQQKGEWDKAIEFYQNAFATMEKLGDVHGMAQTYMNLGDAFQVKWKFRKAQGYRKMAYSIFEQLGAPERFQLKLVISMPIPFLILGNLFRPLLIRFARNQNTQRMIAEFTQDQVQQAKENRAS